MIQPYYQDDAVTIYRGDCLDVLPLLESWDHTISDPPYARDVYIRAKGANCHAGAGAKELSRRGNTIVQLAAGDIGYIDELLDPIAALIAARTERWAIVFSDVETTHRWRAALELGGMRYARTGAWVKPDAMPQMTGDRPGTGFEPCTICHAQGPMRWNGGGSLAVWTHFTAKGDARPDHPCPKPLPLMVELVKLFTDQGEVILDPFGGSGTTAVAAKLSGRRCILIEKDERYAEVAAERLRHTEAGQLFDVEPRAKAGKMDFEASA